MRLGVEVPQELHFVGDCCAWYDPGRLFLRARSDRQELSKTLIELRKRHSGSGIQNEWYRKPASSIFVPRSLEVRMKVPFAIAAALLSMIVGLPASAHHSFAAEFDASKAIRVSGTLTKIDWANPHIYFYLDVKEDGGNVVKWSCEAGSPGALSRRGFKKGDLKLGDTLIVDGYRAKDGSRLMDARRVTLPDGRVVSGASVGDGGPGSQNQ